MIRHVSSIGRFCSIASNVVSGQVEHPTDFISAAPLFTGSTLPGAKPAERSEFEEANRRSEEHTSELQSLMRISYAVFCLKKKKKINNNILIIIYLKTKPKRNNN